MKTATTIRKIDKAWDRAYAAQEALRKIEPQERGVRARRDAAALVLLAPYARAAAASNEYRAEAKRAFSGYWSNPAGDAVATTKLAADRYSATNPGVSLTYHPPSISQAEYDDRLATARQMRKEAFAAARERGEELLDPAKVRKALGLLRNSMVRLQQRSSFDGLPDMPDAMDEGIKARDELEPLAREATALREIRDDAIEAMIADGKPSVDIADHLGISPPRVTQIRQGARR